MLPLHPLGMPLRSSGPPALMSTAPRPSRPPLPPAAAHPPTQRVVDEAGGGKVVAVWPSRDDDDWQVLSVGAGVRCGVFCAGTGKAAATYCVL